MHHLLNVLLHGDIHNLLDVEMVLALLLHHLGHVDHFLLSSRAF